MHQRIIANTSTFVMFDLQNAKETEYMTVTSDFLIILTKPDGFVLHLGNSKKPLRANEAVLLAPFTPFRISGFKTGVDFSYCQILYFRLNLLGKQLVDSVQFSPVKKMLEQADRGLIFGPLATELIAPYFSSIQNTYEFELRSST